MKMSFKLKIGIASAAALLIILALAIWPVLSPKAAQGEANSTIIEKLVLSEGNVRISLPVFEGLSPEIDSDVNRRIAEITGLDNLLEFAQNEKNDARMRYKALSKGDIFHISVATFVYAGGAHGLESRYEIYIDSRTGRFYSLDDLFTPRKLRSAHEAIAGYIESLMDGQDIMFFEDASSMPLPDLFIIGHEGLKIIYPPLSIASYGEGFLGYEIPLEIYEKYLSKSGDFFSALKGSRNPDF
ncbi:MAG: hypothetical protein ACOX8S_04665 [Christensenellales bacterium]